VLSFLAPARQCPIRFRTIQVYPKDWPASLLQAERAVGRWSHARLEAPRFHHATRRRNSRVATRGAGAAAVDAGDGISRGYLPDFHKGLTDAGR